jgi:urease subunit alpha
MFGAFGSSHANHSFAFVSVASVERVRAQYGLMRRVVGVGNCRNLAKKDMALNDSNPVMEVDPETYRVFADGVHLRCEPATKLALAQRYFLF